MAVTSPPRPDLDEANNPGARHADRQLNYDPQSLADIENNYGQTADSSQEDRNIAKAKDQPDNDATSNARQGEEDPNWKNWYVNKEGVKKKVTFKSFFKKNGPTGIIIGLLLGGGGILSFFGGSGLLLVNMKEVLADKFNDRLAVLDERVNKIVEADLRSATTGICTSKLSLRCKMNTMSTKRFNTKIKPELEKRGYTVNSQRTINPLRTRIIDITTPEGNVITAQNYRQNFRNNTSFRTAMLHSLYNPKFASTADKISGKVNVKMGIRKTKNVNSEAAKRALRESGQPDDDLKNKLREDVVKNSSGTATAEVRSGVESRQTDCSGGEGCVDGKRTTYIDTTTGEAISQSDYDARLGTVSQFAEQVKDQKSVNIGGDIAKNTIRGALTSSAFGLGAVDSGCTAYQLIRIVSFAAKRLGAYQLARYAFTFINTADSIKAGHATPEEVEVMGDSLTSTNILGKSATDSYGYQYAAYGDVGGMPNVAAIEGSHDSEGQATLTEAEQEEVLLADETLKYVNGQVVSAGILGALTQIAGGTTAEMDDACGFVKSGWGQTLLITATVAGAVVGFFSGGATIGWGAAAQIAVSVTIGIAITLITPKLVEMAAGTLINGQENGVQAGNAITSGMGAYNAEMAQGGGVPALTTEDAVAYKSLTQETLARYSEVERLDANPLDATNPHTFMGAVASKVTPFFAGISNISSFFSSAAKFVTNTFARILPNVSAADPGAEYEICPDIDYKEIGVAVGPFCNVRYGMSADTLRSVNPDTPIIYMEGNNYVDEDSGEPADSGNDYAKYIEDCMDRSVSIGGYTEENPDKGEKCIQGHYGTPTPIVNCQPDETIGPNDPCRRNCTTGTEDANRECKYIMYRLFYIDQSIRQTMDEGYANENVPVREVNGTVTSPVSGPEVVAGYGPRSPEPGSSSQPTWGASLNLASSSRNVAAVMDGEVTAIEGNTNTITIRHTDGLKSRYNFVTPIVKVGDTVTSGQKIAEISCSGRSSGCSPYLAFSIWVDGVSNATTYTQYPRAPQEAGSASGKAINPANFLSDNNVEGYEDAVNQE